MGDRAFARAVLDVEDWQLETLLDAGKLGWVVDIASRGAERRELRFVTACLEEFKAGAVVERTTSEIVQLIFGRGQRFVRARWVYRCLNCKHGHFYDLMRERVLPLAKGSEFRVGPGGSGVVEWSTLVRFFETRRVS